jgi:N-acyl-D-amino-acid deacylase
MTLVLRGAAVVDGTGGPPRQADVVVEGDRISQVCDGGAGRLDGATVLDLDGLALAPGFIDVHTHYDAQVLWDGGLDSSSRHGVTSAVMGNCGFGLAPTRPQDRDTALLTLENVEGMSVDALRAGVVWSFESFTDYMAALRRIPKQINVGAMLGHSPLRMWVLGEDATERAASDDEVEAMAALLDEGLRAGAVGFSSSRSSSHRGAHGKPVPSRLAAPEEVVRLCTVLRDAGRGIMQINQGTDLDPPALGRLARDLGVPITWTAALTGLFGPRGALARMVEESVAAGGEVYPQTSCRPIVTQVVLTSPVPFAKLPAFAAVFGTPEERRAAVYADMEWRDRARIEVNQAWTGASRTLWERTTVAESRRHPDDVGVSLSELARREGADPFDVMCERALSEDLDTRFRIELLNDDETEIAQVLADPHVLVGLSDAGAHASQLCDANFSAHLLGHWTRELGVLTLEQAVWRLSGQLADAFRISDRGRVAPGLVADLVAFDPNTVGAAGLRRVWDLPGGADRLVADSAGIEHVLVGGEAIIRHGAAVEGVHPGVVLSPGPHTR